MGKGSARFRIPDGAAVTAVFGVVALGALFIAAIGVAEHKTKKVREDWERIHGTREEILQRFPSTEANDAALEVERLSAVLGIDVATRTSSGRNRPTEAAAAGYKRLKSEIGGFLTRQLQQPGRAADDPARAVTIYLASHADDLDALRRQLLQGEMPEWELQLDKMPSDPIPNLLGHIELQKLLLVDALVSSYSGDDEAALIGINAAWKLNRSLFDDPILITQLVSIAATRMQAGALRQLDHVPASWGERLVEHDFRRSLLDALGLEGWRMQIEDPSLVHSKPGFWKVAAWNVARPYVRICRADACEEYRRELVRLTAVQNLCDDDLALHDADLNIRVPWWNAFGEVFVPNLTDVPYRLARLELDLELTVKLIDLRTARSEAGGRWPESVPGIDRSAVCPKDHWDYSVQPDGRMTLAFARPISWPDQVGVVLPTRFSAGSD